MRRRRIHATHGRARPREALTASFHASAPALAKGLRRACCLQSAHDEFDMSRPADANDDDDERRPAYSGRRAGRGHHDAAG